MSADLDTLARRYARGVRELDINVLRTVLAAYRETEHVIVSEFQRLDARVRELREQGVEVDVKTLMELDEYRRLVDVVRTAIAQYASTVDAVVKGNAPQALTLAAQHARDAGIELTFQAHHPEAFIAATAALDPESPLLDVLRTRASEAFAADEAERAVANARRALLTAVAAGWHPRTAAKLLREALATSAYRAQRIARTEILRAYRAGTLELYRQSSTVKRWRWVASLSRRTCAACLAMHGREFDVERAVYDHPNGRCVVVPITDATTGEIARDTTPDGWQWFWEQPFDVRDAILGPALHEALRRGFVSYDRLAELKRTPFGISVQAVPLKRMWGLSARRLLELARERNGLPAERRLLLERADAIAGYIERVIGIGVIARRSDVHGLGWNGEISWADGPYIAVYEPRRQTIVVSPERVRADDSYSVHVLVHELLHAASGTGRHGFTMNAMAQEEAWAEAYARVVVRRLVRDSPAFRWAELAEIERRWERHPYHRLTVIMEQARELVRKEPEEFYRQLAPVHGSLRWNTIEGWIAERYQGQARERRMRELRKLKEALKLEFTIVRYLGGEG
jgi:SPP1 gp7 family putative phage head morphogenesis protein